MQTLHMPYGRKIWQFDGMRFNCQIKIRRYFYHVHVHVYIWRYCTIPPNLNLPILFNTSFGAKPPNLLTVNISIKSVLHSCFCPYGMGWFPLGLETSYMISLLDLPIVIVNVHVLESYLPDFVPPTVKPL